MLETSPKRKRSPGYLYAVAFIAAAGGFNWGYDVILMSGAILYLKGFFKIELMDYVVLSHRFGPAWIEGFTMTSAIYGILVGMLAGGYLADRIGRKRTLIVAAILLIIAAIGTTLPKTLSIWNAFRIIGGVGVT